MCIGAARVSLRSNKGTAFSGEERSALGLRGLLPAVVETLEQQVRRRYQAYQEQPTDVARHVNLRALQDWNGPRVMPLSVMRPTTWLVSSRITCGRPVPCR